MEAAAVFCKNELTDGGELYIKMNSLDRSSFVVIKIISFPCNIPCVTLNPFADKSQKIFENIHPKMPENEFLALYLCIFENILCKNSLIKTRKSCFYGRLRPLIA